MAVPLEEMGHESESFMQDAKKQLFAASKEHSVEYTYSGGATAGNHTTCSNVTQMGRVLENGKFTNTVVVTLHDLGLNGFSNYATLFKCDDMEPILSRFTVFHVDYPCMKSPKIQNMSGATADTPEAGTWTKGLVYPSMEELAKAMVPAVVEYFDLKSIILIGTGLGANIAVRYSLHQPDRIMGLITINPIFYQIGWPEWMSYQMSSITNDKLVERVLDYLYTPSELSNTAGDIISQTTQSIRRLDHNALEGLYMSFKKRTPILMERPVPGIRYDSSNAKILRVRSCIIIGDYATNFMEDALELNALSDPSKSNFCKLADAGAAVYEEQPAKMAEAITLFLQGLGYLATVIPHRLRKSRSNSLTSTQSIEEYNSTAAAVLASCKQRLASRLIESVSQESPSKQPNVEISDNVGLMG